MEWKLGVPITIILIGLALILKVIVIQALFGIFGYIGLVGSIVFSYLFTTWYYNKLFKQTNNKKA